MNKTGLASLIIYSAKTNIDSTLYRFLLTRKNCFAHSPLTFTSLLIHLRRQRLSENWTAHTTVTERLVALVAIEIGRLLIDHNSLGDASVTANRFLQISCLVPRSKEKTLGTKPPRMNNRWKTTPTLCKLPTIIMISANVTIIIMLNISIAQISIWTWSNAFYNSRGNQITIAQITILQLLFTNQIKSNVGFWWEGKTGVPGEKSLMRE